MLGDDVITAVLLEHRSSSDAVRILIETAKQAGGKDNISVVVCQVTKAESCEAQVVVDFATTVIER